jgi:hypothetical protein
MRALTFPKGLALIALVLLVVRRALWVETSKVALPPAAFPREAMAIVVSLVVLGASLFVILSKKYPPESDRWAYGVVGTIVGFWLA